MLENVLLNKAVCFVWGIICCRYSEGCQCDVRGLGYYGGYVGRKVMSWMRRVIGNVMNGAVVCMHERGM